VCAVAAAARAALEGGAPPCKRSRRKLAFRLRVDGERGALLVKVNEYGSLPPWRRVGRSKARHALACALRATAGGAATLVPIAVGEERRGGFLVRCFEVVPWLEDAIDLARAAGERRGTPAERRRCHQLLGRLLRALHEAGIDQDDAAPNNFLWQGAALHAIDFERARLHAVPLAARARALAKLDRSAGDASAATRMRVLRAYLGSDDLRAFASAVEHASAALLRRDVRRWAASALRDGRRFEVLPIASGERALVRRGVDPVAVAAAVDAPNSSVWRLVAVPAPTRRDALRLGGLALALHQRGLTLRPDAFVFGAGALRIAFEWPRNARILEASGARCHADALVVALDRLLALGDVTGSLASFAFVPTAGRWRAVLLDPRALRLGRDVPARGRRALARCRVADWVGAASQEADSESRPTRSGP